MALRAENPKKTGEVLKYFKNAIEETPLEAPIISNFAWYLNKIGLREAANKYHKIAYKLSPNDPVIHNGLAFSYFAIGDYANAELFYKRGLALNPNYITMSNNLAWMFVCKSMDKSLNPDQKNNLLFEAEKVFKDNLKSNIQYGVTNYDFTHSSYYLVIIYVQRGEFEKALSYLEKAKSYSAGNEKKTTKINNCINLVKKLQQSNCHSQPNEQIPIEIEDYPIYFNEGKADNEKHLTDEIRRMLRQVDGIVLSH
jgi:tetratricopeptide (TPR) repeat protein